MNKPIINGIDVSEEIRYCNNCSNLGLDFKTGKFYCSLSHRPDELPEVLSCDEFSANCYIKRLQEENRSLQMLSCANCGEKYLSPDGSELYDKNVQLQQQIEAYQLSENEAKEIIAELEHKNKNLEKELKTYKCQEKFPNQCHCAFRCLGNEFCQDADEKINKYKQALEEIKRGIETYRIILRNSDLFSPPYNFACGAIQALEEVLKKVEDNKDDTTTNKQANN